MAVNLSPLGGVAAQFFNNDGVPLSGGLIYTYTAGTNTPANTYTTGAGTIAHSNPIVLDSAGRVPTGEIWLTDNLAYKFVIKDAQFNLIGTYDNIVGINSNFVNYTASQEIQTATAGQTVFTLTTMAYQPGTNSLSVFVDGVNQYGPGAQYAFTETSSTSVTFASGLHVGASVKFTTAVINNIGGVDASQVTYTAPYPNSVTTNVEAKLGQYVSIEDFGAIGNGVADDTTAIQNALNASLHVVVPAGMTCLISSTITVPSQTRLEFLGGTGNLAGAMPASYFIKKSTMTTVGILVSQRGVVTGGGLLCQLGNTGDGVQLIGNAAILSDFIVVGAGRDGVRVGDTGLSANANSTVVQFVKARDCGRHGIYVHHDNVVGIANANAGTLLQCTAINNTQDGIRVGHAFWVSVINCLTEINGGWGLYLSGVDNDSYPECRWTTVVGGDYNEGNVTGQVYDGSYFAVFMQPDGTSVPTTAPTGLQGGGIRSVVGSSGISILQGLKVETFAAGPALRPFIVDAGYSGNVTFPAKIIQKTTASNGDGVGLAFQMDPSTGSYINTSQIQSIQQVAGKYSLKFDVYYGAAVVGAARFNANVVAFHPETNNTWKLGAAGALWSEVYAANGTINTSDARSKEQVRELTQAEKAVARRLKNLICIFKFVDAVKQKGDDARNHIGVLAQDVQKAFADEGLDAHKYGVFCYDEWDDEIDADGKVQRKGGNSYGVRYDQLWAFIIAAL